MTSSRTVPTGTLTLDPRTRTRTRTEGLTVYGCELDEAATFRELAPRYGVVPTFTAAPLTDATARLATGSRWVSVGHKTRIDELGLRALSRAGVAYLSTRSIGTDHIDVEAATRFGITVGNVAYPPDGVADHTVMLILMAIRGARASIQRTDVHDYRLPPTRARELTELVVGIVGMGRIGQAVADRLRGFGCRILTSDHGPGEHVPLDDLLRRSDVVTLHAPLTATTHHLLDRRRIALLKPGSYVVNTARGALLDTPALLAALESGRLAGAALDVVEEEDGAFYADGRTTSPVPILARLRALPGVVLTPHTAFHTERSLRETIETTLTNCLDFEHGAARG